MLAGSNSKGGMGKGGEMTVMWHVDCVLAGSNGDGEGGVGEGGKMKVNEVNDTTSMWHVDACSLGVMVKVAWVRVVRQQQYGMWIACLLGAMAKLDWATVGDRGQRDVGKMIGIK